MVEDNNGFVNFPNQNNRQLVKLDTGKTFVYIVAFDPQDLVGNPYVLSRVHLSMPGSFIGDDMMQRAPDKQSNDIDDLINDQILSDKYDSIYFPDISKDDVEKMLSVSMVSCICVGWSEYTYELKDHLGFWYASFRELTNEGRKLYYSIKKLHNTKEVRILTFNNI
jgi:hypothetical protein